MLSNLSTLRNYFLNFASNSHFDAGGGSHRGGGKPDFRLRGTALLVWAKNVLIFFWTHLSPCGSCWVVNRALIVQGRELRPEDVALIRAWLQAHPESNRTRFSRALCEAWNWRNGAGRLKDMAARSLVPKLEACRRIQLPPQRTASVNGLRNRQVVPVEHDQQAVEGSLSRLH
jgi:hypothetical protein